MPGNSFRLSAGRRPWSVRIDRTGGSLDHYYHFIMDMAWPLHHWVGTTQGGWERTGVVRAEEAEGAYFARHFEQMTGRDLRRMDPFTRLLGRLRGTETITLYGFNSRVRDHLKTFGDLDAFRRSRTAFVSHIAQRSAIAPPSMERTVILIDRAPAQDERGAARRSILDHASLSSAVAGHCRRSGSRFVDLRLESLGFREQFELLRHGPTVLIGQHGAGLLNGLWMEAPGSTVIELAGADNPPHFENLYTDLDTPYHRIVFPAQGDYGKQQTLLADPAVVLDLLDQL